MRTSADHAEYDYHVGPDPDMDTAEQIAAELAALEREIGRAYIACRDTEDVILHAESQRAEADVDVIAYREAEKRIIEQETALDDLIARWRQLHREGEEAK